MRIPNYVSLLALALLSMSQSADAQVDPVWVNNTFSHCAKADASHYLLIEPIADGYLLAMYDVHGNLKMKGGSMDALGELFDGEFEFYHSNGMLECKGRYSYDAKVGVWERYDKRGTPLAERNYASFDAKHMAYTYVDQMPRFEGGKKIFADYLKQKISTLVREDELGDNGSKLEVGFVIKEDGVIEGIEFTKGLNPDWDMAALHTLGTLPSWIPGRKLGEQVRVFLRLPIDLSR